MFYESTPEATSSFWGISLVCKGKCNKMICKTKRNVWVTFSFASEVFPVFFRLSLDIFRASAIMTPAFRCGHSSFGRAPPCQGGGSEFESRCPLHTAADRFSVCGGFFTENSLPLPREAVRFFMFAAAAEEFSPFRRLRLFPGCGMIFLTPGWGAGSSPGFFSGHS